MLLLLLLQVLHPMHLLRVAPQGKHKRFPAAVGLRAEHLQMRAQRVAQLKQGPFFQLRVALGRKQRRSCKKVRPSCCITLIGAPQTWHRSLRMNPV